MENYTTIKICNRCKINKPIKEFHLSNRKYSKGYDRWCKECRKKWASEYYAVNKDKLKEKQKQWRHENPDKVKQRYSTPEAKEKRRLLKQAWDRKKMKDPMYRLSNNLRGNMYHALKAKKGFRKWEDLVGYTLQDLINHLQPNLNNSMTWENYGELWQVDHITPKSWFKYASTNDPQFKECWALSNLQPKLKIDNIRKGNRFMG